MGKDYEVGYKKPPKNTQFKKGKSGNPKGRPRDTRNTTDMFEEMINDKVAIRDNGQHRIITRKKAMLMRLMQKAVDGDMKAIEKSISLMDRIDKKNHQEQVVMDYIFNTINDRLKRAMGDPGTIKWIESHLSHLENYDEEDGSGSN